MARLGKREREAKRAIIRANLNAPMERTPQSMRSSVSVDRLMGNTHTMGFRAPQQKVRRLDA